MGSLFFHRLFAHATEREILVAPKYAYSVSNYEVRNATLELISKEINRYNVEGSAAELGVYKGNFAMQINYFLPDRKLYLFDTFEGFDSRETQNLTEPKISQAEQKISRRHQKSLCCRKWSIPKTA